MYRFVDTSLFFGFLHCLQVHLKSQSTILDLGCGPKSPLESFLLKTNSFSVGVDIFFPYLVSSKKSKIHSDYVLGDVRALPFTPGAFDAVVALDTIEHLKKDEGQRLLESLRTLARRKVIILTPNGFLAQGESDANCFQTHQSSWSAREFRNMGYEVRGMRGLRVLRGEKATPKLRAPIFGNLVAWLSEILLQMFPDSAFQILCTKEISQPAHNSPRTSGRS